MNDDIRKHSGNKYIRKIKSCVTHCVIGEVDVYSVAAAYNVTSMPRNHALKKILCAGLRGKGDELKDLKEARDALTRDIQLLEGELCHDDAGSSSTVTSLPGVLSTRPGDYPMEGSGQG
jgi:hypothetical protein